jgi:hypothetical protein
MAWKTYVVVVVVVDVVVVFVVVVVLVDVIVVLVVVSVVVVVKVVVEVFVVEDVFVVVSVGHTHFVEVVLDVVVIVVVVVVLVVGTNTKPIGCCSFCAIVSTHVPSRFDRWILSVQVSAQYILPANLSNAKPVGERMP